MVQCTVYTLATVYRGYNTYIDPNECQRILHTALYTRVPYSDFAYQSYMSEQAYNAISIRTKTHYKELTQSVLGIAIVNQVLDADDPSILYLDYFLYRKRPGESIYYVTPNQLVIKYSPSSWKVLTSIDPIKPDWYDDYLNGSSWLMWK